MAGYGQFCPVAKAMELLDERWTMLVIRELLCGSRHFNALRRGVPRMSPSLLSARLRTLVRAGIVDRYEDGKLVTYTLTPAGEQLRPIVEALGQWGLTWVPELGDEDYDPHLLMWDVHRSVDLSAVPPGRTVLRFTFPDVAPEERDWWVIITPDGADLCSFDPGHPVTATVECELRTLTRIWRGQLSWTGAQRSGELRIDGPSHVARAVPRWLPKTSILPIPTAAAFSGRVAASRMSGAVGAATTLESP
jgi:DNA-binding HxlR family transcriptional regulator